MSTMYCGERRGKVFKITFHVLMTVLLILALAVTSAAQEHVASGSGETVHQDDDQAGLTKVVERSFATHPGLKTQEDQVVIQKLRHRQSFAGYLPRLDLYGSAGVEETDHQDSDSIELNPWTASAVLTQPIFSGFETQHSLRRTTADKDASDAQLSGTAEQVALEVIQAYLKVLSAQETVDIAEQNLQRHKQISKLINARLEEGVSDQSDAAHADGRLALANSNLLSAQNNLTDAMSDFEAVAGFRLGEFSRPALPDSLLPKTRESAIQKGKEENPILQSSFHSITAANEQYKQNASKYYPHFDVQLKASASDETGGEDEDETQLSALVVMNWNLYNGGTEMAERKISLSELSQARNKSLRVQRNVEKEVRLAWEALETTRVQKNYMAEHVSSSVKVKKLYIQQFEIHRRSLLDLLDTENELFQAERTYIINDYQELSARYRLLAATGQLLATIGVDEPTGK